MAVRIELHPPQTRQAVQFVDALHPAEAQAVRNPRSRMSRAFSTESVARAFPASIKCAISLIPSAPGTGAHRGGLQGLRRGSVNWHLRHPDQHVAPPRSPIILISTGEILSGFAPEAVLQVDPPGGCGRFLQRPHAVMTTLATWPVCSC